MALTRLIRHVPVALALSVCLWPSLSRGDVASVFTWSASDPAFFLGNSSYSTLGALQTAQGSNAGLFVYPSNTTFTAGYNAENTDIVIQTPGGAVEAAAYQDLLDMIVAGRNGGSWTGSTATGTPPLKANSAVGIFSDSTPSNTVSVTYPSAATDTKGITSIGIAMNDGLGNDPHYTTFDVNSITGNPIAVNADSILIKYTYNGDNNLKGNTQLPDIANALAALNANESGWSNGGSLYGNTVQLPDIAQDLAALNGEAGNPDLVTVSGAAQVASQFAAPIGVPEPGTGLMTLVAAAGLTAAWAMRRRGAIGSQLVIEAGAGG